MNTFYSIPFLVGEMSKKEYNTVQVEESIRQNIKLMVTTMPSQYRYDANYGSVLNINHFRLPKAQKKGEKKLEEEIREKLKKNLLSLIEKNEPRLILSDLNVIVHVPDSKRPSFDKNINGKITFEIKIAGKILGQDDFIYNDLIPLL